jgi:hypothetical protein
MTRIIIQYNHTLRILHPSYLAHLNSCTLASFLIPFGDIPVRRYSHIYPYACSLFYVFSYLLCPIYHNFSAIALLLFTEVYMAIKSALHSPAAVCRLTTTETLQRLKMVPSVVTVRLLGCFETSAVTVPLTHHKLLHNTTALLTSILAHFTRFVSEENGLKDKDIAVRIILKCMVQK